MMERVSVFISRVYRDNDEAYTKIRNCLEKEVGTDDVILIGDNRSTDKSVKVWAKENDRKYISFRPVHEINRDIPATPFNYIARNKEMIRNSDKIVVFHDGTEPSENHAVEFGDKLNKVFVEHAV